MIVVDKAQMTRLEAAELARFEDRIVDHLTSYAPELTRILGSARVRSIVDQGVAKAATYGLTNRGPIRLILELMFSLGSEFDTDPALAWAHRVLTDPSTADQMTRADHLFRAAQRYFELVVGPNQQFAIRAMRRLRYVELDALRAGEVDLAERAIALLSAGYPEKANVAGRGALEKVVTHALDASRVLGVTSESGRLLLCAVMFGFGHGALRDPIYPWIGATLRDSTVPDPQERIRRLYRKTRIYLEAALKNLAQ